MNRAANTHGPKEDMLGGQTPRRQHNTAFALEVIDHLQPGSMLSCGLHCALADVASIHKCELSTLLKHSVRVLSEGGNVCLVLLAGRRGGQRNKLATSRPLLARLHLVSIKALAASVLGCRMQPAAIHDSSHLMMVAL